LAKENPVGTVSLNLTLSEPIDINEAETATIDFTLDAGPETISFEITAVPQPLGSGPTVPVGSTGGFSGAGGYQEIVPLNLSGLIPTPVGGDSRGGFPDVVAM
jgi:hypothetical protein